MKSLTKRFIIRQGIFLLVACIIALLVALYEKKTLPFEYATIQRLFCDGTLVSAIIFIFIGAMQFISHWGGFDSFGYSYKRIKAILSKNTDSMPSTYFDYLQEKHSSKNKPCIYFLTTGALMIALSIVSAFLQE